MKKMFMIAILAIGLASLASAQVINDRAIGLRLGYPYGVSFLNPVGDANRLELGIGDDLAFSTSIYGAYHWVKDISKVQNLQWFIGPGASAGYDRNPFSKTFQASVFLHAGVEYHFDDLLNLPIEASVDFAPGVGYGNRVATGAIGGVTYTPGIRFAYDVAGLSVRYKF